MSEAAGIAKAVERGVRSCRVEDAPSPLIHEADVHHVTHMVTAAVLDHLRAVAADEGTRDDMADALIEHGMRARPYDAADDVVAAFLAALGGEA